MDASSKQMRNWRARHHRSRAATSYEVGSVQQIFMDQRPRRACHGPGLKTYRIALSHEIHRREKLEKCITSKDKKEEKRGQSDPWMIKVTLSHPSDLPRIIRHWLLRPVLSQPLAISSQGSSGFASGTSGGWAHTPERRPGVPVGVLRWVSYICYKQFITSWIPGTLMCFRALEKR